VRNTSGEDDVLGTTGLGVLLQFLKMITIPDQEQTQRLRRRLRYRSVSIDQRVDAFVLHHRRNIADGDRIVAQSYLVCQVLISGLNGEVGGLDSVGDHADLGDSNAATVRVDEVLRDDFCKSENMIGQHTNALFRSSPQT